MVYQMYKDDSLEVEDIRQLIHRFGNQSLDFFGAIRSCTYDSQILCAPRPPLPHTNYLTITISTLEGRVECLWLQLRRVCVRSIRPFRMDGRQSGGAASCEAVVHVANQRPVIRPVTLAGC